jgi:hypothetical protein
VPRRPMWLVDGTYKRFFFGGFEDSSLFKYLFERKCNDILERCSENMYAIENEDCEHVV